jgi:ABC-type polysaccharide/polyol phosphate export permease
MVTSLSKSLQELPEYRHVLGNLILRDLKVKYQSKALGFIWSLLHPAILIGIWYIVFSLRVFNFKLYHYWAYLICGIIPFRFIQESISEGAWSVRKNSAIIRKVYVPMEILVIATVSAKFVDFLLQLLVAILLLGLLHRGTDVHFSFYKTFVVLPGAMVLTYIFILGICMPLAGWTVIYRDLDHIIGLFLTASFYITPIFWWKVPESLRGRLAFALNPFMDLVELFRGPMYWGKWPSNMAVGGDPLATWGIAMGFAVSALMIGYFLLGHVKSQLAEVV